MELYGINAPFYKKERERLGEMGERMESLFYLVVDEDHFIESIGSPFLPRIGRYRGNKINIAPTH